MSARNSVSPVADHVIGVFSRDTLSAALAATHRAGFGPHTKVLDGARANAAEQLARAGLFIHGGKTPPADGLLIVVTAPGRAVIVADLFERVGAEPVYFAARRPEILVGPEAGAIAAPDIRIGEGAAAEG